MFVVVLFVFACLSISIVFFELSKMGTDGTVVDFSGKQRMVSQRITKLVFAKHRGLDDSGEIAKSIAFMDRIVKGLVNGDSEWNLPKADNAKFLAKMKEMADAWEEFKDTISRAEKDAALLQELLDDSEVILKIASEVTAISADSAGQKVSVLKISQGIVFFVNLLILVVILLVSQRKIASPLSVLTDNVEPIAGGDLRVEITASSNDEIGALSKNLGSMVSSYNTTINSILVSANSVVSTVETLRRQARTTAEGAQNQSGQAAQIATAAEEMSQTITDIARNASTASGSAAEAMSMADSGKEITDTVLSKVDHLFTSTEELSSMVNRLNISVSEIGEIVTVIKDIADQTNLLALNAAIEAARAGEQGRGFAVVADEVRKLAERTIRATGQITSKIGAVQQESEQTARTMSQTAADVSESKEFISRAGDSLNGIVGSVKKVQDEITRIATAVDEQSAASEEVAGNIERTSAIAKEMERMADGVMHEVNSLTKIAEELRNATAGFRTRAANL